MLEHFIEDTCGHGSGIGIGNLPRGFVSLLKVRNIVFNFLQQQAQLLGVLHRIFDFVPVHQRAVIGGVLDEVAHRQREFGSEIRVVALWEEAVDVIKTVLFPVILSIGFALGFFAEIRHDLWLTILHRGTQREDACAGAVGRAVNCERRGDALENFAREIIEHPEIAAAVARRRRDLAQFIPLGIHIEFR